MPAGKHLATVGQRLASGPRDWCETILRRSFPTALETDPRPAVVTVNYRSDDDMLRLLVSLTRVLPQGSLHSITVVDNGSYERGGRAFAALRAAGIIRLITRRRRTGHGPGLNSGLRSLAAEARAGDIAPPELVWILDADVCVLREDVISAGSSAVWSSGAAMAGQLQDDELREEGGYAHISSVLLRPDLVWQRGLPGFVDSGAPGIAQQRALRRLGRGVIDFPFYRDGYLLHLGQGSLRRIVDRGDTQHPMFDWAAANYELHHHGNPAGPQVHARFAMLIDAELGSATPEAVVAACTRARRIVIR